MLNNNEEMKKMVENRLGEDRRIDASRIQVAVAEGRVTLTGFAETLQASAIAQADANGVAGVKTVDNRIEVPAAEKVAAPTDEALRARIQAALMLEPGIASADLVLAVADGVVFIDGYVETLKAKNRIATLAAAENGVLEVHNNLKVITIRGLGDEGLKDAINAALHSSDGPENTDSVYVQVEGGVVTLEGDVPAETVRRSLANAAAAIPGVVEIRNRLYVSGKTG